MAPQSHHVVFPEAAKIGLWWLVPDERSNLSSQINHFWPSSKHDFLSRESPTSAAKECKRSMDPLSIVGLTAAAVQFVDFSTRLFTRTANVYQNAAGARSRIELLEAVSHDLTMLSGQISEKMAPLKMQGRSMSVSDMNLLEQCRRCEKISNEVMDLIAKIKDSGTSVTNKNRSAPGQNKPDPPTHNFRMALKVVWEENKIRDMELRLEEIKSSLMTALIADLWYVA